MAKKCREPKTCVQCGKVWKPVYDATRFCSRLCIWEAVKGPVITAKMGRESAERRGDTQRGRGERKAYRKRMGRHEHRAVAEKMMGRRLRPTEIVCFRDGDRFNITPSNLLILPNRRAHASRIFKGRKKSPETIAKMRLARRETISRKGR